MIMISKKDKNYNVEWGLNVFHKRSPLLLKLYDLLQIKLQNFTRTTDESYM